jgi:glycosyltransferase 2 family protein
VLRSWKVWAGFAVSAIALFFTLRNVNFTELGRAVSGARVLWFVPAVAVFSVAFAMRAWRWSLLMGRAPFWTTLHAMNIGYMMNTTLPLRLGEVGRAFVIGERTSIPMVSAFSSIVVERVLDLAMVVGLFAFFAAYVPMPPSFSRAAFAGGVLVIVMLIIGGILVWQAERTERILRPILERFTKSAAPWLQRFRDLCSGFRAVGSTRRMLLVLVLTVLIWLGGIGCAYFTMGAFLPPVMEQAGLVLVTANLGGAVPSAPGGLGIVQGFAISALVLPFHVPEDKALAFVFVWSLSQQLLLIVFGLIGLGRIGMSFAEVRASGKSPRQETSSLLD